MTGKWKAKITPTRLAFSAADVLLDKAQNEQPMLRDHEGSIRVEKDICYTSNRKWKKYCKLDIYRKPSDMPQPVLFYIHGGGFAAGGKKYRRGFATWMAKTGICVINADYGLSPLFGFRESMAMLAEGVQWVADNAKKYNFDLDRVMVGGDSSGGYCALYLMDLSTDEALRKELNIQPFAFDFAGAYLNCGIYDMRKMLHTPVIGLVSGLLTKDMMGAYKREFEFHPDRELCSPIHYVNARFPKEIFLTYAKYDALCFGQTQQLMERLEECGVPYREYHSTNPLQNHCFMFNWQTKGQCAENNEQVFSFVEEFVNG